MRVPKEHLRVEAYGTVDEANSAVGVVLAVPGLPSDVVTALTSIQHDMFDLGGELCIPGHRAITAAYVERLEQTLDRFNEDLPPLKDFILPGGGPAAAACHLARTVTRRAERRVWELSRVEEVAAGSAAIPEPALGPVVRDCAGAGPSRKRQRSALAAALVARLRGHAGLRPGWPRSSSAWQVTPTPWANRGDARVTRSDGNG